VTQNGTTTTTYYGLDGWNPAKPKPLANENFDVWCEFTRSGSTNTLTVRYWYGDGTKQVFAQTVGGHTDWLLTDHLGSVVDLTADSGTLQISMFYDAFGNRQTTTWVVGPYAVPEELDGLRMDVETGLLQDGARQYDPTTGRTLTRDPLGLAAGDPNTYRWVHNSPTNWTDPSGMDPPAGMMPNPQPPSRAQAITGTYQQWVPAPAPQGGATQTPESTLSPFGHVVVLPGPGQRWTDAQLQALSQQVSRWSSQTGLGGFSERSLFDLIATLQQTSWGLVEGPPEERPLLDRVVMVTPPVSNADRTRLQAAIQNELAGRRQELRSLHNQSGHMMSADQAVGPALPFAPPPGGNVLGLVPVVGPAYLAVYSFGVGDTGSGVMNMLLLAADLYTLGRASGLRQPLAPARVLRPPTAGAGLTAEEVGQLGRQYAGIHNSNQTFRWDALGRPLTAEQRSLIRNYARDARLIQGYDQVRFYGPGNQNADFGNLAYELTAPGGGPAARTVSLPENVVNQGRQAHFDYLNQTYFGGVSNQPAGWTWHHMAETGQMQLVPLGVHEAARPHIGLAAWVGQ